MDVYCGAGFYDYGLGVCEVAECDAGLRYVVMRDDDTYWSGSAGDGCFFAGYWGEAHVLTDALSGVGGSNIEIDWVVDAFSCDDEWRAECASDLRGWRGGAEATVCV